LYLHGIPLPLQTEILNLQKSWIKERSIFLAPIEGVTDPVYRKVMSELYPGWDYMACDFLRIPSVCVLPEKTILKHYGPDIYQSSLQDKNYFQILSPDNGLIEEHLPLLEKMGFEWLDLNLGCPSKTVTGNKGGSYLLSDLEKLRLVVKRVRQNFNKRFTAKIRVGFHDDSEFENILHLLEEEGVEAITIHGRTRDQAYKGRANWDYIKRAVEICDVPIIGNGDIWELQDIEQIFDETKCHGVMLARCALKTPWIADLFYEFRNNLTAISQDKDYLTDLRREQIPRYFKALEKSYLPERKNDFLLNRFKGLSRYLFDDFDESLKKAILRSKSLENFYSSIDQLYV
jgi:tRNA-dihydrouridine synthase